MITLTADIRDLLEVMDEDKSIEKGDTIRMEIAGDTQTFKVTKIYKENDLGQIEVQLEEFEEETRDIGEDVDYQEEYDGALDLISEMKKQVRGTDLNSPGWSLYEQEFLNDLDALEEMIDDE